MAQELVGSGKRVEAGGRRSKWPDVNATPHPAIRRRDFIQLCDISAAAQRGYASPAA